MGIDKMLLLEERLYYFKKQINTYKKAYKLTKKDIKKALKKRKRDD